MAEDAGCGRKSSNEILHGGIADNCDGFSEGEVLVFGDISHIKDWPNGRFSLLENADDI